MKTFFVGDLNDASKILTPFFGFQPIRGGLGTGSYPRMIEQHQRLRGDRTSRSLANRTLVSAKSNASNNSGSELRSTGW